VRAGLLEMEPDMCGTDLAQRAAQLSSIEQIIYSPIDIFHLFPYDCPDAADLACGNGK
jgi:hypothetical protein